MTLSLNCINWLVFVIKIQCEITMVKVSMSTSEDVLRSGGMPSLMLNLRTRRR